MSTPKKSQYSPVVQDGLCRNLRCKGMYVGTRQQMVDPNLMPMDTTNWWCNRTSKPVGPDFMPCNKGDCGSARKCFEPEDAPLVT
jgi:hypothetical protein